MNRVDRFAAAQTRAFVETERHLPELASEYERIVRKHGREAARRFGAEVTVTAAVDPEWKPPRVDDLIDTVALKDALIDDTAATRTAAAVSATRPLMTAMGLSFSMQAPMVERLVGQTGRRAAALSVPGLQDAVRSAITEAFQEGLSVPQTQALIVEKSNDLAGYQSEMLARTDLIGTANGGSLLAAKVAFPQGTLLKRWTNATNSQTVNDGRIRPTHLEANAQTVEIDEPFTVGEDQLLFPGDPNGSDAEVCNCFPESTLVEFPSLRGVTRRWYEGDLVVVRTSAGHVLSGTPNHPVLGPDGWVALGDLEEGGYLVCGTFGRDDAGAPNEDRPPSTIGEVYRLASIGGQSHRVRASEPDFHGDGEVGEVEVVAVDGSLLIDSEALDAEEVAEFALALADVAVWGLPGDESGSWALDTSSASRGVRRACEVASLVRGQARHANHVGFGAGTNGQVEIAETANDGGAADSERTAHSEDALSVRVSLTEIIEVNRQAYQGFVFNLDTGVGVYSAGGIIAANCRCTTVYQEARVTAAVWESARHPRWETGRREGGRFRPVGTTGGEPYVREREPGEPAGITGRDKDVIRRAWGQSGKSLESETLHRVNQARGLEDLSPEDLAEVREALLDSDDEEMAEEIARKFTVHASGWEWTTEDTTAAAPDVSHLAMIAVYPTPEQQASLHVDGGEEPENLHVTLVFLGETGSFDPDAVREALRSVTSPVLEGRVAGIGRFAPGENGTPVIALPSVRGLAELRDAIVTGLAARGIESPSEHGWLPHLTLEYRDEIGVLPDPPDVPLTFGTVDFVVANERESFPLGV